MGGLYKNVRMSIKTADKIVLILLATLVAVTAFLVTKGGFTVKFESMGGTAVSAQKLQHGQTVETKIPIREGYTFCGWYLDPDCTVEWNCEDIVTESMTLYAKWE